jgi:hypothetical protein
MGRAAGVGSHCRSAASGPILVAVSSAWIAAVIRFRYHRWSSGVALAVEVQERQALDERPDRGRERGGVRLREGSLDDPADVGERGTSAGCRRPGSTMLCGSTAPGTSVARGATAATRVRRSTCRATSTPSRLPRTRTGAPPSRDRRRRGDSASRAGTCYRPARGSARAPRPTRWEVGRPGSRRRVQLTASTLSPASAAVSVSFTTSAGWETIARCPEGTSAVVAPMRLENMR